MTDKPISTVRDLVKAYGGPGKFAEFLHVVPSYVSNMLRDEELPRGYHLEVYIDCKRRNLKIDTCALFGVEDYGSAKSNPRKRPEVRAA